MNEPERSRMRILIDIKHPAHVHFFKNFIRIMEEKGHEIKVTAREKEIATYLLEKYGINYIKISSIGKTKLNLIKELIIRNHKFSKIVKDFSPDLLMGIMGITEAPVGKFFRVPSLVFYDTECAKLTNFIVYMFCTKFITPSCYRKKLGKKNLRYDGYQELSYLHPRYFTPNGSVLKSLGLSQDEKFTILRFVSYGASHDLGQKKISHDTKIRAIKEFSKFGRVFITSESDLPKDLEYYKLDLSPEKIHSLIYYSTLLYSESATMASEAAVLGTNAIYLDDDGRGYTDEQEKKYGLVFNYTKSENDQYSSVEKGIQLLKAADTKQKAQRKRMELLSDTIDITDFMIKQVTKLAR